MEFTGVAKDVKLMDIRKGIIHQYLEDWLVRAKSHQVCLVCPTYTGPVAEPSTKNTGTAIPTSLSSPAIHVLDRSANSHRKTSSPRLTTHETHTVVSQKQLESTGITRKGHSNSQVLAPPSTMVAGRRQCTQQAK